MALTTASELGRFYAPLDSKRDGQSASKTFEVLCESPWSSSKLEDGNAFSFSVAIRTAGMLASAGELRVESFLSRGKRFGKQRKDRKFREHIRERALQIPQALRVQEYPPTPTVGYWFVDGVDRLGMALPAELWQKIVNWTADEFHRQLSLVSARNEATMDPVALAMAACLCARLRRIVRKIQLRDEKQEIGESAARLPGKGELIHAIRLLFTHQTPSGIWPKYFPLFHYPGAGANFCFSFELLEAVLAEFGTEVLYEDTVPNSMHLALRWCELNRLDCPAGGEVFRGWNSGGELDSLRRGKPEAWATAVVHMFLVNLIAAITHVIEERTLREYGALPDLQPDRRRWDGFVDVDLALSGQPHSLKTVVNSHMISGAKDFRGRPRAAKINGRRSALLFGPPGTSKTNFVRSIAEKLGWPCVEITPTHLLRDGLEKIYVRADEVFRDLDELSRAVVLLDEMDSLVHSRDGGKESGRLDVTREFLTTSMLPKLAHLHDRGRVLFFMATNHQERFDPAITRAGRFDLLACMGPPTWAKKVASLEVFWVGPNNDGATAAAAELLTGWIGSSDALVPMLDLFTFGELRAFFDEIREDRALEAALANLGEEEFRERVNYWAENTIHLREEAREKYYSDRNRSRLQ